jgi:hypothetical protein
VEAGTPGSRRAEPDTPARRSSRRRVGLTSLPRHPRLAAFGTTFSIDEWSVERPESLPSAVGQDWRPPTDVYLLPESPPRSSQPTANALRDLVVTVTLTDGIQLKAASRDRPAVRPAC